MPPASPFRGADVAAEVEIDEDDEELVKGGTYVVDACGTDAVRPPNKQNRRVSCQKQQQEQQTKLNE